MNELRELYQEVILDHNRRPRNFGEPDAYSADSEGFNPLCGDKVHVYVLVEGGVVQDVHFTGTGCAISQASASLMTECVKGKTIEEARRIFDDFHAMVTASPQEEVSSEYEELMALGGVREFPIRIKCATLAWHSLQEALAGF